jgi:hypothetical protein
MTSPQLAIVEQLLLPTTELHLGDCLGADAEAYWLADALPVRPLRVGHPPLVPSLRAHLAYDVEREPRPYLERNRSIVEESELLVGTPGGPSSGNRGGTWYTIRYAMGKIPVYVVMPEGKIMAFNKEGQRVN